MTLVMSKYFALFVSEASEHLAAMTGELVRLEEVARGGAGTSAEVDELFRHFHSIKGMAASLELDGIAALAHRAEDLVGAFRAGRRPDPASIDVLLATVDALVAMVERVRAGESPERDAALLDRLGTALGTPAPAATAAAVSGAPRTTPTAAPGPAVVPVAPSPVTGAAAAKGIVTVSVRIASGCPAPAVRGFLVAKRLERLGTIRACSPPLAEVRSGRLDRLTIELTLETSAPVAEVNATLAHISDLEQVTVEGGADGVSTPGASPHAQRERGGPEEQPVPPAPARSAVPETARTVRVRADLLDTFLDSVGELIVATARLREIARGVPEEQRPVVDEGIDQLHTIVKSLHDQVMSVRMTPLAMVTGRLPRAVRDVARRTGKQVEVVIRGAEIELDRTILDELGEPLLHVLRNAVGHGIESPEERLRAGKPETGKVTVAARRDRDRVVLEIGDDGRGMDPARLRAAAVQRGAITAEAANAIADADALMLACLPGVSTAERLTDVEGRGVGMDAVKRTVEALGGTVAVESSPGLGTRWTFRLPVSVAVQTVLLVRVGDEVLGIPVAKVQGAMQVVGLQGADGGAQAREVVVEGKPVPLRDLGEVLGFGRVSNTALSSIVVAEEQGSRVGFVVDALLGQQDVVMRPLVRPFDQVPGLAAVTVLANGRPLFILDVLQVGAA